MTKVTGTETKEFEILPKVEQNGVNGTAAEQSSTPKVRVVPKPGPRMSFEEALRATMETHGEALQRLAK